MRRILNRQEMLRTRLHNAGRKNFQIGAFFEFGTFDGNSTVDFCTALKSKYDDSIPQYWDLYLFDSFEGLPESRDERDEHPAVFPGKFRSKGVDYVRNRLIQSGMNQDRIHFIVGQFQESLTESLRNELAAKSVQASFVNMDCDLYSSTKVALDWVEPLLHDGSIILFDDIYYYNGNRTKGQLLAIDEFNSLRTDSGLFMAGILDNTHRTYLYWKNEK